MNESVQRMLDEETAWEQKLSKAQARAKSAEQEAHKQGARLVEKKLEQARAHAAHHRQAVQQSTKEHVRDIEEKQQKRLDRIRGVDAQKLADSIRL